MERASSSSPAAKTILIIDDEVAIRRLFGRALQLRGYRVVDAGSVPTALACVAELQRVGDPLSLILLDLTLLEIDGWTFREMQRRDVYLASIPTIIMSGHSLGRDERRELGADDYILKPIAPSALAELVGLRLAEGRLRIP